LFLSLGCLAWVLVGCATNTRQTAQSTTPKRTGVQASAPESQVRYIEVTGSRIPVKVQGKTRNGDLPVNLAVVDPETSINRGHPTTLDMLLGTPWVSQGYRGK
jgi:hypothetical protein